MKVLSVRNQIIRIEFTLDEANTMFREGMQILLDRWFGHQVVVLPVKDTRVNFLHCKKHTLPDGVEDLCIREAVIVALKEKIEREEAKRAKMGLKPILPVKRRRKA